MIDLSTIDYSSYDRWEIAKFVFYPRPEWTVFANPEDTDGVMLIPVETGVAIGARFHRAPAAAASPTILFFHGNGEIVADYDDIAGLFTGAGINFFPVEYRGYGRSTGTPTITGMMRDSHVIFAYTLDYLQNNGFTGPLIVMGRSLGSAAALELASHYSDRIDGLIIESGFAYSGPLLLLMGVNLQFLGLTEEEGFRNIDKIAKYDKPTLVIHAEYDQIIPFAEGQKLFDRSPSAEKRLLKIPGANHNDIFFQGMKDYMEAVRWLAGRCNKPQP